MSNIIIVSENEKSFSVLSIETALRNEGHKVYNLSFKSDITDDYIQSANLIMLVGCEEIEEYKISLNSIKKKCHQYKKEIVIYGLQKENDDICNIISDDAVIKQYLRPIAPAEFARSITNLLDAIGLNANKKRILVVDDSGIILRTMMEWLEGKYTVQLANSAAKALPIISMYRPDLILLDYEMPICSGAQLLKKLRSDERTKDIPVIFLTSRGDEETVKSVLALKPEGYVLKPAHKSLLFEKIDKVLLKSN